VIRSIGVVLALIFGSATAGEPADCYGDGTDSDTRYTSIEPEVLRVTDADVSDIHTRNGERESRSIASAERDPAMLVSLSSETSVSN
jgi:hypothetical protein